MHDPGSTASLPRLYRVFTGSTSPLSGSTPPLHLISPYRRAHSITSSTMITYVYLSWFGALLVERSEATKGKCMTASLPRLYPAFDPAFTRIDPASTFYEPQPSYIMHTLLNNDNMQIFGFVWSIGSRVKWIEQRKNGCVTPALPHFHHAFTTSLPRLYRDRPRLYILSAAVIVETMYLAQS